MSMEYLVVIYKIAYIETKLELRAAGRGETVCA